MYGEDPKLVADMSVSYIQGMQQTGVGACAKHFIANNQETNRNISNANVSKRAIRELYARGFESAVKEGKVKSVMTAYSAVNGVFSSYNKELLTNLLKKEWGFEGIVVSDWGAVKKEKEKSLEAGMDMILCGPNDMSGVKKAMEENRLSEEIINERVRTILRVTLELKAQQKASPARYHQEELLKNAYDTIIDGSVLLKNDKSVLPIAKGEKIAFYGQRSKELIECGTGSTKVTTELHSNIWEECQKYSKQLVYETMDDVHTLVYTVGAPAGENMDRETMDIEPADILRLPTILKKAKEKSIRTVVVLNVAGPVDMRAWESYADSILCIFIPGCMGGTAAADLLFGTAIPAGKLPITFPLRYEDTPAYPNFPCEYVDCYYGEELFVGYRSYEQKKLDVQYPFGYGRSYTEFACELLDEELTFLLKEQDQIQIRVKVKNIGNQVGSEVIQVYGMEQKSRSRRPVKELLGFQKVYLQAGEEKIVSVTIKKDVLRVFDAKKESWIHPIGNWDLLIGTSSRDIFAKMVLQVKGTNPYPINGDSTIGEILEQPKVMETINQFTGNMFAQIDEENLKFMVHMKLSDVLSQGLIGVIPDSAKVKEILTSLYVQLENLES